MKKIFFLFSVIFLLSGISALNLEVNKKSSDEVMIKEFQNPVFFDLEIKNLGGEDNIYFYNLVGLEITPDKKINIKEGETKSIQIKVTPLGEIDVSGYYTFNYFIRGENKEDLKKTLTFKIVPLKETFELESEIINIEDERSSIFLINKINYNFNDIYGEFNSNFFDFNKTFSIQAYEKKELRTNLDKERIKKLTAGFYSLEGNLDINGEKITLEDKIEFSEKDYLQTNEKEYGFFVKTKIIEKTNEGNTLTDSTISIEKGIFSRLFTSFNKEPDFVEREGNKITYLWREQLSPGEKMIIEIKTNWIFPLILILFLIILTISLKKYSKKDVELKKRLSFIKTKGGEFALKVTIIITAKTYVEKVNIIDKLPPLVKLYHKFMKEEPSKINEKGRRIEWDFSSLEEGEKRIVSYVIYSKIGVLGKFALPSAIAIFEKNGKIKESSSNKAFFVSEQKAKEEDIY